MNMALLDGSYTIYQFPPTHQLDAAAFGGFLSVTRTAEELSVVAASDTLAGYERAEGGWRVLRVAGTLDFGLVGVISRISSLLAGAGVSVFVISTYDTDYILIRQDNVDRAVAALAAGGIAVSS